MTPTAVLLARNPPVQGSAS